LRFLFFFCVSTNNNYCNNSSNFNSSISISWWPSKASPAAQLDTNRDGHFDNISGYRLYIDVPKWMEPKYRKSRYKRFYQHCTTCHRSFTYRRQSYANQPIRRINMYCGSCDDRLPIINELIDHRDRTIIELTPRPNPINFVTVTGSR